MSDEDRAKAYHIRDKFLTDLAVLMKKHPAIKEIGYYLDVEEDGLTMLMPGTICDDPKKSKFRDFIDAGYNALLRNHTDGS